MHASRSSSTARQLAHRADAGAIRHARSLGVARWGDGARELERTIDCVADGWDETAPDGRAYPRLDLGCQTADESYPLNPQRNETYSKRINMRGRSLYQLHGDRVFRTGVFDHDRRERTKVARRRLRHSAHDGVWIRLE